MNFDMDKVTCAICQDTFNLAVETCCGHAFCEYCLNKALEKKPNLCPLCQKNPSPVHPSYTLRSICDAGRDSPAPTSEGTAAEHKLKGNEAYGKSQYADAIMHYNYCIDLLSQSSSSVGSASSDNATIHSNRAQCFIKLAQFHRALEDLTEAIRLNPNDIKAYIRRGLSLKKIGDFKGSREAYLKAQTLDTTGKFAPNIAEGLASLPPDSTSASSSASSHNRQQQQQYPQQQQQQQPRQSQPPPQQPYYPPQQPYYTAHPPQQQPNYGVYPGQQPYYPPQPQYPYYPPPQQPGQQQQQPQQSQPGQQQQQQPQPQQPYPAYPQAYYGGAAPQTYAPGYPGYPGQPQQPQTQQRPMMPPPQYGAPPSSSSSSSAAAGASSSSSSSTSTTSPVNDSRRRSNTASASSSSSSSAAAGSGSPSSQRNRDKENCVIQ